MSFELRIERVDEKPITDQELEELISVIRLLPPGKRRGVKLTARPPVWQMIQRRLDEIDTAKQKLH